MSQKAEISCGVREDKIYMIFRCLVWDVATQDYVVLHTKHITVYTGNFPDLVDDILDFLKNKFKTSKK